MFFLNKKIDGLLVMTIAVAYFIASLRLEDGIVSNNQINASTFPIMVAALLFLCSLILVIKNDGADHHKIWPKKTIWYKIFLFFACLFIYAFLIDYLGFFFLTFLLSSYVAISLRGKVIPSIIASLVIMLAIQLLFSTALEINLPLGELWEKWLF